MRSRLLVLALLCSLLGALAVAAPASASPRLCVYIDERQVAGGSPTGHAFVQLLPDSGPQAGKRDLVWGFSPKVTWQFLTGSEGLISDNSDHAWDWKLCNTVSNDNYNKAAKVVEDDRKSTPRYALLKFNCTDWAYKVAQAAGMKLPDATALFTRVYDPEQVAKEFKKMYAQQGGRNIPGGNAVFHNNPRKDPKDSPDFRLPGAAASTDAPFGDSYTDIVRLAFDDPKETADLYDFSSDTAKLDDVTLDSGRELRLALHGVHPDEGVTAVHWGDGEADYQGHGFHHTYKKAGTYHVTGIALARADVYRYMLTVHVKEGGDRHAEVSVDVPKGAPKPDANAPEQEGPPVEQLPA
jgi:hypothetical protein